VSREHGMISDNEDEGFDEDDDGEHIGQMPNKTGHILRKVYNCRETKNNF